MGLLASGLVATRWADRSSSTALRIEAARSGVLADVRASIADEEARSTVVALAADLDIASGSAAFAQASDPDVLAEARSRVDERLLELDPETIGEGLVGDLEATRLALDIGEASYGRVDEVFRRLMAVASAAEKVQARKLEAAAGRERGSSEVRERVRARRPAAEMRTEGRERIRLAIEIISGTGGDQHLIGLQEATSRFHDAVGEIKPHLGPRARAALESFQTNPGTARTEFLLNRARYAATQGAPIELEPLEMVDSILDGFGWIQDLNRIAAASSADLEEAARSKAADDTEAVALAVAGAALLTVASVAIALASARRVVSPALALEAAARSIKGGDFELDDIPPGGSRELSSTVAAFNEMAATLVAVENHAIALAEDPGSPLLDEPLPGRTGDALQVAIDRLRQSIRQAEEHRSELEELATRDGLTGLLNRRAAIGEVERGLARAQRDDRRLFALYIDMDGLKELNDTHGHAFGDAAISELADALRRTTRQADVVARPGGDEFLVVGSVAPDREGLAEVEAMVSRVHEAIRSSTVAIPGGVFALRASIGVALTGEGRATAAELVDAADRALYTAKQAGRDRVAWDPRR